jgi:hypothetical protein
MKINQFVVVYLDVEEISRPAAPLDVSLCKGILSSYSFFFLGKPQDYAMRPYSCWCNACSRVRGRGYGTAMGWWGTLEVPGCARYKLTVRKEGHFTVEPKVGIARRAQRMDETVAKALLMVKPGSWGCVQSHDLW